MRSAASSVHNKEDDIALHVTSARVVVVSIGIIGLLVNGVSLKIVLTKIGKKNAFAAICVGFLCCNIGVLLTGTLWTAAAHTGLSGSLWSKMAGHLAQALFYGCITLHLTAALNRFCAITFPTYYQTIFTIRRTYKFVFAIWTICICTCFVYYLNGCNYSLDLETQLWGFQETTCGGILQLFDLVFGVFVVLLMTIFNVASLLILQHSRKKLKMVVRKKASSTKLTGYSPQDMSYFIQSHVSGMVYLISVPVFHLSPLFIHTKWGLFCSVTVAFIISFALDPIVIPVMYVRSVWKMRVIKSLPMRSSFGKASSPMRTVPPISIHYNRTIPIYTIIGAKQNNLQTKSSN